MRYFDYLKKDFVTTKSWPGKKIPQQIWAATMLYLYGAMWGDKATRL